MKRIVMWGLALMMTGLVGALAGCGSPQVKPDRDQIQRRSDKSFHELEREEERQRDP